MARRNLLDEFRNSELIDKYRLDRVSITFLSNRLDHLISPKTLRNKSLSTTEKVMITPRYFASSVIQFNDGEIHEVSQPTVSRVIEQVTDALCSREVAANFIKYPTLPEELRQIKIDFFQIANFPNVVGFVDGTHIQIQAPCQEEPTYVNRMGYHSINTQIAFDAQSRIIDIVPRWPGSAQNPDMSGTNFDWTPLTTTIWFRFNRKDFIQTTADQFSPSLTTSLYKRSQNLVIYLVESF